MNCSIAIQYLPLDGQDDEDICRIVDEVISYIGSTGIAYSVGPFETTIEGDYDTCMEILKNCQMVGAAAGCEHVITYAKINYRHEEPVMSTEQKVGKYHALGELD